MLKWELSYKVEKLSLRVVNEMISPTRTTHLTQKKVEPQVPPSGTPKQVSKL